MSLLVSSLLFRFSGQSQFFNVCPGQLYLKEVLCYNSNGTMNLKIIFDLNNPLLLNTENMGFLISASA